MDTPKTINIEKYVNALNNLVGMDIGYLGDSDENVNAIVEVIVAAKKLEERVKELTEEKSNLVRRMQTMIKEKCIAGGIWPAFVAKVVEDVGQKLLEESGNDEL